MTTTTPMLRNERTRETTIITTNAKHNKLGRLRALFLVPSYFTHAHKHVGIVCAYVIMHVYILNFSHTVRTFLSFYWTSQQIECHTRLYVY